MRRCHHCGKILYEIPFKCHRCGHIFCRNHHLPENHNCSGLHSHGYTFTKKYCRNCGREITGHPTRCNQCGEVFCGFCGLPENHGCRIRSDPEPVPSRPPKRERSFKPFLKKIRDRLTLKNFTILSILLMLIGFFSACYLMNDYQKGVYQPVFEIGVFFFFLAYFIYTLKCWGTGSKIWAVFMLAIPLLAYSLATSKLPNYTTLSFFVYLVILLVIFAIISAIPLYICDKLKRGIERHVLKRTRGTYQYFSPNSSYSFIGVIVVSLLLVNYGGIAMFSNNLNSALQSSTINSSNSPYASPSSTLDGSGYSTVQTTQTSSGIVPLPTATENHETGLTSKTFSYVLRGKSGTINLNLYSGVYNEISSEPTLYQCTRYNGDSSPCTSNELQQYYLDYVNKPDQEKYLDNLVNSIKAKTSNQDDQARIAISLVQNIPYDYAKLNGGNTGNTRYPYEVLYANKGVCEEKSLLLAYLLRGLGYGVVLFEYPSESHMAVGIKSPAAYAYDNTGYAFVESTSPTIITDDQENYVNVGKLTETPHVYTISDGISFNSISEEYNDAKTFNQLELISQGSGGILDQNYYYVWLSLVQKYGLKTGN